MFCVEGGQRHDFTVVVGVNGGNSDLKKKIESMKPGESGSQLSYYSHLIHWDSEVVGAVGGRRPGAVVQQVDLFGAPVGTMVADVICQPEGIDEFNRLRLGNRPKGFKEIVKNGRKR